MDIYDSSYFILNKKLQSYVGLWPYESGGKKIILRFFFGGAIIIMAIPHIIGLRMYIRKDIDRALEHIAVILYCTSIFMKMITSMSAEKKLKVLYDGIASNWQIITDKDEKDKLIEHSQKGRFLTLCYLIYAFVAFCMFITLPLTPIILNKLIPLNESRPYIFILDGEFIVDRNLNYSKIYFFDCITIVLSLSVALSVDTTYAVCVQQCVGLFAILKYRLRKPHKLVYNDRAGSKQGDATYEWMIGTIRLHKKVLSLSTRTFQFFTTLVVIIIINRFTNAANSFKDNMETSYSFSFLILMSLTIVYFSILSVLLLINSNELLNLVRYSSLLFGLVLHLFYLSWPGQQLIDCSSGLFRDAYFNEWYEGSVKSKNLLRILTLRCVEPCVMTAGGLYIMNLENFLSVIKTSASYITVFASFR